MMGFKAFEKKFKKFGSPATAVNEGKAVDFEGKDGYRHVRNISVAGRVCRLLSLDGYEGSYVIQDAVSRGLQLELAHHCLSDCLQPKNKTNLHGHTEDSLLLTQLSDIWARESNEIDSLHGDPCPKLPKSLVLSTVRWVTLGYQYDWSARKYIPDQFVPFPDKLAALCSEIAGLVGEEHSLKPDAAIVNFYPEGSVMGGHIDDAEQTYDHPVLSISIGCPCLFLLGGFDKETDPLPLILRSGDILIMGGKSRLRVHAVPKIFTQSLPPLYLHPNTVGKDFIHLEECNHFLKRNASNILKNCHSSDDDVASKSSPFCETSDYIEYSNSKRVTNVSFNASCKKQRHDQFVNESAANFVESAVNYSESAANNESDKKTHAKFDTNLMSNNNSNSCSDDSNRIGVEVNTESDDVDGALRCCAGLTPIQEIRVLKYLQTTRININVRQVYNTQHQEMEQGQEHKEERKEEHYSEMTF